MKYIHPFAFFLAAFLISCNGDEQAPEPTFLTGDYGTYRYNGVEKTIEEAYFHLRDSGTLLLNLIDEDGRESIINIHEFDGQGHYQEQPFPDTELSAHHYYFTGVWEWSFQLNHLGTSSITIVDYTANAISGTFDLKLSTQENLVQSNWTEGQFFDVPAFEILPASAGQKILTPFRIVTVDSIHTRLTNTFFLETHVYTTTRLGTKGTRFFRWKVHSDETLNPTTFFGDNRYSLSASELVDDAFVDGNGLTTSLIDGAVLFEDLPIDVFPKPYGLSGELMLYRGSETISFDDLSIDEMSLQPVLSNPPAILTATNQQGNVLIARPAPVTPFYGLWNSAGKPGAQAELNFYSTAGQAEPDWTVLGFMQSQHSGSGTVNIGFETDFLHTTVETPTYVRLKDHPL